MGDNVVVTGANFQTEVLQSPALVLLQFGASWCGSCKTAWPIIEQFAEEYAGSLKAVKISIEEEGELAERHNVTSLPTLVVYKNGEIVNQVSGGLSKQTIHALFKDLL
jgi:thioredoxin 1